RAVSCAALSVSRRIDEYGRPGCGEETRLFPTIAPNTGGFSFDRVAAASGWYWPAYTWKVPVGSETRARHIGCPSVPTFSTSVITPTTKTLFTFAPSGVTMYEGGRSPVPSASKFASLYSEAKSRQATSRITLTPPGLRASPALPPARPL